MHILLRAVAIAASLSLSTAAFAQANEEGNAPENNAAATAPNMGAPHHHHYRHHRHHRRHRSSSQREGNGSNGASPDNSVTPNTNPGGAETTNPQSQ